MVTKAKRRRLRKRRAAEAGKRAREEDARRVDENDSPDATALSVLSNPDDAEETGSDLILVEKSLRWPSKPDDRQIIKDRLMEIVQKKEVSVVGKDGELHKVDGPADVNSMKAADIILKAESQNQKDEHFEKRQAAPRQSGNTQINVGVTIGADERRERLSAIASRIGIDFVPEVGAPETTDSDSEAIVSRVEPKKDST